MNHLNNNLDQNINDNFDDEIVNQAICPLCYNEMDGSYLMQLDGALRKICKECFDFHMGNENLD